MMAASDNGTQGKDQIIIVGGGIGGLATAISLAQKTNYRIRVLESSLTLKEVGAGIQITPNASRVLCGWGLREEFEKIATVPNFMEILRYDDNRNLGLVPSNIGNFASRAWGHPHWLVHRMEYQAVLARSASVLGVTIDLDTKVSRIDADECAVQVANGDVLFPNLIIGADGIHSRVRRSLPELEAITPTRGENYCYRVLIPREKMMSNPLTATLMQNPNQQLWAGHLKHIIGYSIAQGAYYNLVLMIPDALQDAPLSRYNQPGNVDQMRREFAGCHALITALLELAETCAKWTIAELPALPTWTSTNGRVVLLGDAAHAMSPHAASGAATTIEDAEVLGLCVAACASLNDLPNATKMYEKIRKQRCERIQEISRQSAMTFSMPDGPQQKGRDEAFGKRREILLQQLSGKEEFVVPTPDMNKPFPHPDFVTWLYGYDAAAEAKRRLCGVQ